MSEYIIYVHMLGILWRDLKEESDKNLNFPAPEGDNLCIQIFPIWESQIHLERFEKMLGCSVVAFTTS